MATIAPGGTKNAVGRSKKGVFFRNYSLRPLGTFRDFLSFFAEKVLKKTFFYSFPYCFNRMIAMSLSALSYCGWRNSSSISVCWKQHIFSPVFLQGLAVPKTKANEKKLHLSLGVWTLQVTLHLTSSIFMCTQGHLRAKTNIKVKGKVKGMITQR